MVVVYEVKALVTSVTFFLITKLKGYREKTESYGYLVTCASGKGKGSVYWVSHII